MVSTFERDDGNIFIQLLNSCYLQQVCLVLGVQTYPQGILSDGKDIS